MNHSGAEIPRVSLRRLDEKLKPRWRNRQTRMFEGHVKQFVGVQVPPWAPRNQNFNFE